MAGAGSNKIDWTTFSYSLSEVATGATWVNGKTIYRKTVALGTFPSTASILKVAHNVSGISYVVRIEGVAYKPTEWTPLPLVYRGTDKSYDCQIWVDGTYVYFSTSQDRSAYNGYVTFFYTKS